ncbi:MAG: hypothetical protein EHM27_02080 [Deltaproteobacteria bacterium]|nr:MAG: hypothetical protein EHM27_02080 [Deltaproteobacteria bacterium]
MALPSWFQINGPPIYEPIPEFAGKKMRLLFLDRTLKAVTGLLAEFVFSEAYTQKAGLLQGLDPRFKLIGLLAFVVGASLLQSLTAVYGLSLLALVLAGLSRVGPLFFLKRVWLVLPLFAGFIALPATLNLFTPGELVWKIGELESSYRFGPYGIPKEIGFTKQGLTDALFLVGRVGLPFLSSASHAHDPLGQHPEGGPVAGSPAALRSDPKHGAPLPDAPLPDRGGDVHRQKKPDSEGGENPGRTTLDCRAGRSTLHALHAT